MNKILLQKRAEHQNNHNNSFDFQPYQKFLFLLNFGINNIELDNINMPNNFGYFSNVDINIESAKDKVSFDNSEYKKLTYGLGEELENQIFKND